MAADVPGKWRTIAISTLRILLAVVFLYTGASKLTGTGHTVEYFAAIGWGQWFRYLTGVFDISGAVLLLAPKWVCYGAIVLGCSVGTGALISVTVLRGNPTWGSSTMASVPLLLTLLAVLLGWLTCRHRVSAASLPVSGATL